MSKLSLEEKHKIEREFHDDWAKGTDINEVLVDESFEACTALENQSALAFLGDLRGKRILDVGCGMGEASVYFAKKGADVYSLDISREFIQKTEALAKQHQVSIRTVQSPTEKMPFEDNFFDLVYGGAVLHHVDIRLAMQEVHRVLKKEGRGAFIEPIKYNPVIHIYRKIASEVRTPTEVTFGMKDFWFLNELFEDVSYDFCWFLTLTVFLYMYFIERVNPVKDRYWKRIIREHKHYKPLFNRLNRWDKKMLKVLPFLKYLCWTVVIKVRCKKQETV